MLLLTPTLPAPLQLPCRTYFWRDSIPRGDHFQGECPARRCRTSNRQRERYLGMYFI